MSNLLLMLVRQLPGFEPFYLQHLQLGDFTPLLAGCDWIDEHYSDYGEYTCVIRQTLFGDSQ